MKKAAIVAAVGFLLIFSPAPALGEGARSAVLMEAETGRVLYESNAHEALPMASTTKIMTALLALEKGNLQDTVVAGPNAYGVPGTSIYLEMGEKLTLEDMLYGLMLASGNDAAVAIAEHIGGSVDRFCRMMTAKAEEIGCENTVFSTPHGLPAQGHHTTAWDLALIAREAMKNPVFREIVATERASLPWQNHAYNRVLTNKNKLLSTYPGALGVKTGYTRAAGRCLVFAAEREGLRLIGVVLNCPDWFEEATALLDQGFAQWQMVTAFSRGEAVRQVPVVGGTEAFVQAIAGGDAAAPVKLDAWPDILIELPESVPAGVLKGQTLGAVKLLDQGRVISETPLVAAHAVPERSFPYGWGRIWRSWLLAPGQ